MNKSCFYPVRGKEENILNKPHQDGYIYFATDTGRIFLDTKTSDKLPVGGTGASLYYGNDSAPQQDQLIDSDYILDLSLIENYSRCKINDLILNQADGSFYKINEINLNGMTVLCTRLAVSGNGSGSDSGSTGKRGRVSIEVVDGETNILNKEKAVVKITVNSMTYDGDPVQGQIPVLISFAAKDKNSGIYKTYLTDSKTAQHGVPFTYDVTKYLRDDAETQIICTAQPSESNIFSVPSNSVTITTHGLSLIWNEISFSSISPFENKTINVACEMTSSVARILDLYFDDQLIYVEKYDSNNATSQFYYTINNATTIKDEDGQNTGVSIENLLTHGAHTIKAKLSLSKTDGTRGGGTNFISKEIALLDDPKMPLIWLGDFKEEYYTYDTVYIPYLVYDSEKTSDGTEVHLYKNGIEIDSSPRMIKEFNKWSYWEITDLQEEDNSYYTIRVGKDERETRRNITFTVKKDPRDMKLIEGVYINFDSKGRTNTESKINRETLIINDKKAKFDNFNWYNNGWIFDDKKITCLRISNGAKLQIPLGKRLTFQGQGQTNVAHTIEFQFKIKNIADYSKLITNYTRYKAASNSAYPDWDDTEAFKAFKDQRGEKNGFTNYDAFLANYLKITPNVPDYDDLEYSSLTREIDYNNAVISIGPKVAGAGIYVGTQDSFFTNGTNTVSLDFIEDTLLNLSFVYTGGSKDAKGGNWLLEIYLNGVLTSIVRSDSNIENWTISSDFIEFDSKNCDIDLYKVRIYDKSLNAQDIVQNYAFDLKNTTLWDQKDLVKYNNQINEYQFSFSKMKEYNENHPDNPLMPYIILHTKNSNDSGRLPYNKENDDIIGKMTFVNTPLEAAYSNGSLSKAAEKLGITVEEYYEHHCPSWTSGPDKDGNEVSFSVQGTSSQFYPRRNYKAKTEGNMYYHLGPYSLLYEDENTRKQCKTFYMDNNTVGTDKFTLKIDYMESSGDYNRGFANMVSNAYSKHPIEDYKEIFNNFSSYGVVSDYRTSVKGFPVLAFHQIDDEEPFFIGKYNMLLDKGSDACYGFKPSKDVTHKIIKDQSGKPLKVSDVVECWEFENNSRGFCSFRDPWNRRVLSFKAPEGADNEYTNKGAPIVADYFEYRYNTNKKILDLLYNIDASSDIEKNQETLESKFVNAYSALGVKIESIEDGEETKKIIRNSKGEKVYLKDKESSNQLMLDIYSNWEKAVAWVWSTCVDAQIDKEGVLTPIPSIGTYTLVENLAEKIYEKNIYYYYNNETEEYVKSTDEFKRDFQYFEKITDEKGKITYKIVYLTDDEQKVYKISTYYSLVDKDKKIYLLDKEPFNPEIDYYILNIDENSIDEFWRLDQSKTYNDVTYTKDSIEYRQAKFVNELTSYFDLEYLITYFLMTEIFECYDSRGKNCMMATWGPKNNVDENDDSKGNYIWYPIFYDIDTQLGINNTGIPSFEYYIDATIDGSFSTNDSVLWNNLYTYFKSTIKEKYKQLMGKKSELDYSLSDDSKKLFLRDTTGSKIKKVEQWYTSDPEVMKSYSVQGDRPLMALNCDEYYKYITPTNKELEKFNPPLPYGRINEDGSYVIEKDTYFYALQGDRKLYRQQFLNNRLEYIDSWLTLDHYERGGVNRIRSRVSANNPANTSDKWITGTATNGATDLNINQQYWKDDIEFGEKIHEFDGEYWITFTPIRNSYVTVGTDAANFPSIKYTNSPVRFETTDLKNGVMSSGNYREQLYYIYGLNQMKSLGDMSKLYFQEFELYGEAPKMIDLLLGYDGKDENEKDYKNWNVNKWTIIPDGGMPLLKEVNLSNIRFKDNSVTENFSSCEKLENYRNIGSNITSTEFANGVALNILHLTKETQILKLTEARLLNKIIREYEPPQKDKNTGRLVVKDAQKGLYIPDLTDKAIDDDKLATKLHTLQIAGGNLGYYSYELLNKFYYAAEKEKAVERKVSLTNVQWAPYFLIEDEKEKYNEDYRYYIDNGHYRLEEYDFKNQNQWELDIKNKLLYLYDENVSGFNDDIEIKDINLLENLIKESNYHAITGNNIDVPTISGIIYIDNDDSYDEGTISNEIQANYPDLTIFFKNINPGYSAKFVIKDETGLEKIVGKEKISKDDFYNKLFFENPSNQPKYSISTLTDLMGGQYIFNGWQDENGEFIIKYSDVPAIDVDGAIKKQTKEKDIWDTLGLEIDKYDYTFYAVFSHKQYIVRFYDGDGIKENAREIEVNDGGQGKPPEDFIVYLDDSDKGVEETNKHIGWSQSKNSINKFEFGEKGYIVTQAKEFWPIFETVKVHDNILSETYFEEKNGAISLINNNIKFKGKVTIPKSIGGTDITAIGNNFFANQTEVTGVYFEEGNKIDTFESASFHSCKNLQYIEIPKNLKTIQARAFQNCTNLKTQEWPLADGANIGESAFSNSFPLNQNLDLLFTGTFTGGMSGIGQQAFSNFYGNVNSITFGTPTQAAIQSKNVFSQQTGAAYGTFSQFKDITNGSGSSGITITLYVSDRKVFDDIKELFGDDNEHPSFKLITIYQQ